MINKIDNNFNAMVPLNNLSDLENLFEIIQKDINNYLIKYSQIEFLFKLYNLDWIKKKLENYSRFNPKDIKMITLLNSIINFISSLPIR